MSDPDQRLYPYVVSGKGMLHIPDPAYGPGVPWATYCRALRPTWQRMSPPLVYADPATLARTVVCQRCEARADRPQVKLDREWWT